MQFIVALAVLAAPVAALFKCNNINVDGKKYDLSDFDFTTILSDVKLTPPSTTNTTWYINPCGAITENEKCPPNSQICGVQTLELQGDKYITQVIPISSDSSSSTRKETRDTSGNADVLQLDYTGAKWGDRYVDAKIIYECTQSTYQGFDWDGSLLVVEIGGPGACAVGEGGNDRNDKPQPSDPSQPDKEPSSGGSWLWTFFLILLVVFAAYVGGTTYANYKRFGTAKVELGPLSDLLKDLPYLLRDFWQKIMSTFGSSRGGYSAV